MERREFLKGLGLLAVLPVLDSCAASKTASGADPYRIAQGELMIDKASMDGHEYLVIKDSALKEPIFFTVKPEPTALSMTCTHKGCDVEAAGDKLICPCHASEFAFDGSVLEPPATMPLKRYQVTTGTTEYTVKL